MLLAAMAVCASPVPTQAAPNHHKTIAPATLKLGTAAKRIAREEREERERRRAAYAVWFHRKNGYDPTEEQFRDWHYRAYGIFPSA
jgi:hypothetical protein